MVTLQEVLMKEERLCYETAAGANKLDNTPPKSGIIHALYNSAVYRCVFYLGRVSP